MATLAAHYHYLIRLLYMQLFISFQVPIDQFSFAVFK